MIPRHVAPVYDYDVGYTSRACKQACVSSVCRLFQSLHEEFPPESSSANTFW